MPVSIEIYRSRIGQFYRYSENHRIYTCSENRNFKTRYKKTYKKTNIPSLMKTIIRMGLFVSILLLLPTSPNATSSKLLSTPRSVMFRVNFEPEFQEKTPPSPEIDHNFLARYKFGNKGQKKGGITIMHWNKGSSILHNKMEEIKVSLRQS